MRLFQIETGDLVPQVVRDSISASKAGQYVYRRYYVHGVDMEKRAYFVTDSRGRVFFYCDLPNGGWSWEPAVK